MGINLDAQESPTSTYITSVYTYVKLFKKKHFPNPIFFFSVSRLITERFNRVYLHSDIIYSLTPSGREYAACIKTLHDFTEKVIRERKELRKTESTGSSVSDDGVKKRKAFLDLLLDSGSDLSDIDLREEVDTFMFEVKKKKC